MPAVDIRVAEFLLPHYETALQALGGTEIERTPDPTDAIITVITVDMPGVPAEARTMSADLTLTADRPAHIQSAVYLDAHGAELATVTYP